MQSRSSLKLLTGVVFPNWLYRCSEVNSVSRIHRGLSHDPVNRLDRLLYPAHDCFCIYFCLLITGHILNYWVCFSNCFRSLGCSATRSGCSPLRSSRVCFIFRSVLQRLCIDLQVCPYLRWFWRGRYTDHQGRFLRAAWDSCPLLRAVRWFAQSLFVT